MFPIISRLKTNNAAAFGTHSKAELDGFTRSALTLPETCRHSTFGLGGDAMYRRSLKASRRSYVRLKTPRSPVSNSLIGDFHLGVKNELTKAI